MRFPHSTSMLMKISAIMISSGAALAQDAPPAATPAPSPTSSSPFTESKKGPSDSPFGTAEGAAPAGPLSLDEAIKAEEQITAPPKSATLTVPAMAPGDDPFANNQGTLDPLAKPVATPIRSILDVPETSAGMVTPVPPKDVANPFNDASMPAAPMMSGSGSSSMPPAAPVAVASSTEDSIAWASNLEAAIAQAKQDKKSVLVVFSGDTPAWEGFNSAINSSAVAPRILKNFVPVKLDIKANNAVAQKFAVKRAPYIVVLNKWGYTAGHVQPSADANALLALLDPFMKLG